MKVKVFKIESFFIMILLGILIVMLFKILETDVKHVTFINVYEQKNQLSEEKALLEIKKKENIKYLEEIHEYEEISTDDELINILINKQAENRIIAGLTKVKGEGVIVIINDSNVVDSGREASSLIVHDFDIQSILTDLRNSGAEAMSVNGERVVIGKSRIKCAGPTIKINEVVVAQPFIIKAIGDKYKLSSAIDGPNGYASVLRDWDIFIEVNTSVDVSINAYSGSLEFEYLEGDKK